MKCFVLVVALAVLTSMGCHPGPVVGPGSKTAVGGTIAGMVSTAANAAIAGRRVTAIDAKTGTRFEATTGTNGGYTIEVPEGTYRLEVELQPGETIAKQPSETRVNRSDLDPRRDFVIAGGRS